MYSTCIFCNSRLGTNAVVEELPVGRRLAFDPEKGRLWVLCPSCRQWNLSPLETRWEALEALERLYRETPTRYSTEQIGLARHREGLELVRIGRPTRPEYAAWRYGGELLRRRRKALVAGGVGLVGAGVLVGGAATGLLAAGGYAALHVGVRAGGFSQNMFRKVARLELPGGEMVTVREKHARNAALERHEDGWRLRFPYARPMPSMSALPARLGGGGGEDHVAAVEGEAAVRAAGKILPALNRTGASSRVVDQATRFIETTGTADAAFGAALETQPSAWRALTAPMSSPRQTLHRLPGPVRLGLEMAAHEEAERRALEGELARLEKEWQDAEEIAAIADDLLLPERIRRLLGR